MTRQKMIKDILIQMAIDGTLPSDMTELDEHVFDDVFEDSIADLYRRVNRLEDKVL